MTAVLDKSELPEGAQLSIGNTKNPVGVLQSGLSEDGDVLAYQAIMAARLKRGANMTTHVDDNVLQRVREGYGRHVGLPGVRMSQETINQLQQGDLNRDQAFVGENSQWTGYFLESPAKMIMPLDTPFKNILPRVPGAGINRMHWRTILDVFGGKGPRVGNFILQQKGASQQVTYSWGDMFNDFKTLSVGDLITEESEMYARSFDPAVRAKIVANLIPALMLGQETWYIQAAQKLWAPPKSPTPTTATTGGTVAAATYWFLVTAVNANGESLAVSPTAATVTTTGSTSTVTLVIFTVPGASSYNVYCGSGSTQPANSAMWLQSAITQFGGATALNDPDVLSPGYITVTMTAPPATSGTAYSSVVTAGNTAVQNASTESNTNGQPLTFDGYLSLIYLNAGVGSQRGVGGNTSLVKTVGGVITGDAIDSHLESGYYNARANPEYMLVSTKDSRSITKIVSTATAYRVVSNNGTEQGDLTAGFRATRYINPVTGRLIQILMLPYLPQGTIAFTSLSIPFPAAEVGPNPLRVEYNKEMWAREFIPDQGHETQWKYSAYSNESVACQYLGGQLLLDGITLS